ncbi:hypothetical protein EW146_g1 [Bondarzewia mesenterica]|uniref:Uncharacterized protein n=1 Tax=Bondarzewia mesenterica TaxID=1095465 RepID=A0A4S4M865_9AGAM|nr:hypothetical protein EW146_g1 [Bondarzewia mesenterica]
MDSRRIPRPDSIPTVMALHLLSPPSAASRTLYSRNRRPCPDHPPQSFSQPHSTPWDQKRVCYRRDLEWAPSNPRETLPTVDAASMKSLALWDHSGCRTARDCEPDVVDRCDGHRTNGQDVSDVVRHERGRTQSPYQA